VLGAVGLGAAAAALLDHGAAEAAAAATRRDRLEDGLLTTVAGARRIGHPTQRVPGIAHLLFQGVEGESLLVGVPDVAMATGSACSSATLEASHVLQALGLDRAAASSTIRLSLGWTTTDEEVDAAAGRIRSAVARIREVSARATPG
jgi:cysteine desulfurase